MQRGGLNPLIWAAVIIAGTTVWLVINLSQQKSKNYNFAALYQTANKTVIRPATLFNFTQVWEKSDDYIQETNSVRRLYDLVSTSNLLFAMHMDQTYLYREDAIAGGLPTTNRTKCDTQLSWIREQLTSELNYLDLTGKEGLELTNWMDTFGRPESGTFSKGRDVWMGSYEECQRASLRNNEIRGRYCMGRFRFESWPQTPGRYEPEPALRIGLCLPETCDSLSIEQHNETINWIAKQQLPDNLKSRISLQTLFCLPDERSPLRKMSTPAKIFMYSMAAWVSFIVIVSILFEILWHKKSREDKQNKTNSSLLIRTLRGFTLRNSIKSFNSRRTVHPDRVARVNMDCLEFAKLIMTFIILISHSMIFSIYKTQSRIGNIELSRSDAAKFLIAMGRIVDTFFILSGVSMSYILLQKMGPKKLVNPFVWISTNIIVFLRLTPIHAIVILFNKYITPHLGSGPWWDYGVDVSARYGCKNSPWTDVFPNAINIAQQVPLCNPPAWFMGPYTQLRLAIPIITYTISTLPSQFLSLMFVAIISLISSADFSMGLYKQDIVTPNDISHYGPFMVLVIEKFQQTGYMDALGRVGSVIIGCYTGYLLHLYQNGEITDMPRLIKSKIFNFIIVMMHFVVVLMPVYGYTLTSSLVDKNAPVSPALFSAINLVIFPLWSVLNCTLIISGCTHFKNHVFTRLMSNRLWAGAGKLGLAIYLIHYEVIVTGLTFYENAPADGHFFDALKMANYAIVTTTTFALFFYLIFDAPTGYITSKFIIPGIQQIFSGPQPRRDLNQPEMHQFKALPLKKDDQAVSNRNLLTKLTIQPPATNDK